MNTPESMFFRSVTQATDSTLTGCTANTVAANHALGTANRSTTRQNKNAVVAINRMLVTWNPVG